MFCHDWADILRDVGFLLFTASLRDHRSPHYYNLDAKLPPTSWFHKECKDSEDLKDFEESNDQRETKRSSDELERLEGVIGTTTDIERNEGKARVAFSMQNDSTNLVERRKLLQAQAALAQEKFGPSGSVE